MKDNLIHARTCVYNVNYHIVWSTKYRRKVLNSKIENRLKEILIEVAKVKEFTIHEMEVGECDHIHLFISALYRYRYAKDSGKLQTFNLTYQ